MQQRRRPSPARSICANSTAPTSATPIAPPIARDSEIVAVATPSASRPAASCTVTCVGGITMPRPAPTSTVSAMTTGVGALATDSGEPEERDRRERQPDLREDVDAARVRDEPSRDRGGDDLRQRDRQQQRARRADAHAAPELQVQRHVEDHREQRAAEAHHDGVGPRDRRHLEEMDRDHRIVVAALPSRRARRSRQRRRRAAPHIGHDSHAKRWPPDDSANRNVAVRGAEQQRADDVGSKRARRARGIGACGTRNASAAASNAERHVDEEHRAPAEVLGEIGAKHRSGRAGQCEHRREIAGEAAALARRYVLADQRLRQRHEAAAAQSLQRAEQHQPQEVRRERAGDRRTA